MDLRNKKIRMSRLVEYTEDGVVSRKIMHNGSGNVTLFAFDKGGKISPHSAPYDALVQIIEGFAEVKVGDDTHKLNEGESLIMPANIEHSLYAPNKFKMLLTMIKGKKNEDISHS